MSSSPTQKTNKNEQPPPKKNQALSSTSICTEFQSENSMAEHAPSILACKKGRGGGLVRQKWVIPSQVNTCNSSIWRLKAEGFEGVQVYPGIPLRICLPHPPKKKKKRKVQIVYSLELKSTLFHLALQSKTDLYIKL